MFTRNPSVAFQTLICALPFSSRDGPQDLWRWRNCCCCSFRGCSQRKRTIWLRDYFIQRDLSIAVASELLLDHWMFVNFVGLDGPKIQKNDTAKRSAIPLSTRLAITLRFLITGDPYHSLIYLLRVHYSTISLIIPEENFQVGQLRWMKEDRLAPIIKERFNPILWEGGGNNLLRNITYLMVDP